MVRYAKDETVEEEFQEEEQEEEEKAPMPQKQPSKKPEPKQEPKTQVIVKEFFTDTQLQHLNDKINVIKQDLEEIKAALKMRS